MASRPENTLDALGHGTPRLPLVLRVRAGSMIVRLLRAPPATRSVVGVEHRRAWRRVAEEEAAFPARHRTRLGAHRGGPRLARPAADGAHAIAAARRTEDRDAGTLHEKGNRASAGGVVTRSRAHTFYPAVTGCPIGRCYSRSNGATTIAGRRSRGADERRSAARIERRSQIVVQQVPSGSDVGACDRRCRRRGYGTERRAHARPPRVRGRRQAAVTAVGEVQDAAGELRA